MSQLDSACACCGLPVAFATVPAEKVYCCYGCRFAAAVSGASGAEGAAAWSLARLGLSIFLAMNVMAFTMALWGRDVYGEEAGAPAAPLANLFRYLCLLFALPVLFLLGGPLLENALRELRQRTLTTDLLLLAGIAASYVYSAISVFRDQGPIYFEVGCVVLILVTLGRWLEATSKLRATQALDALQKLLPDLVQVLRGPQRKETVVPRGEVVSGDLVRVAAGERLPCDGRVRGQAATIDEQLLTGESQPIVKEPGEHVNGGTLNLDGDLLLDAEPGAAALTRMTELMRHARLARGRHQQLADRVTTWFLPVVVLLALGTTWYHSAERGLDHGLLAGLAVVLIACPCALGVATPLTVWVALDEAARRQVLFRSGEILERLAVVHVVCFDKTGTLTTGETRVAEVVAVPGETIERITAEAVSLATTSNHVHARAICRFADLPPHCWSARGEGEIAQTKTLPGRGLVRADRYLGNMRLMREQGQKVPDSLLEPVHAAGPQVLLSWAGQVRGMFLFQECRRPEAASVLEQLVQRGLHVEVLTGDRQPAPDNLEGPLVFRANLLPEDKVQAIEQLRERFGPVAMVGDGLNDAPALAAADVGIALGCGADVARASAGVCLLSDDLARIPWTLQLARQTVVVIRQNLFWAFIYNGAGIAFACTGHLNPVLAALAMTLSSLLVVSNALRLKQLANR